MTSPAQPAARFSRHVWWVLLLAALGLWWVRTERRIAHVNAVTNSPTWSVDAPGRDASSPTGWEKNQREIIVPGHHNPSFWWIMEAQLAAERGQLRLRHIGYDAPPDGRDIRRTAPYRWWLTAVGWLYSARFGGPPGFGIERGALMADPLLLGLLLVAGAVYSAKRMGAFGAVGFVLGGSFLFPLAANFQPGAPDPHSLAWVLAAGSMLPLLASLRGVGSPGSARGDFILAGVFGGLGFWNDATSQSLVLTTIFLSAIIYELACSRAGGRGPSPAPARWREWGLAGALVTLAASVFEFAPGHFSWSLDAVSPVHAIGWWGMGELLHAMGTWFREGRGSFDGRRLVIALAGALALMAWPLTARVSHSGGLLASDLYAHELANAPGGVMAASLADWLDQPGESAARWATLLPGVLLLVLPLRAIFGRLSREERACLVFAAAAMVPVAGLAFLQLRWWNLVDILALAGLTALFSSTGAAEWSGRWAALGAALLIVPGWLAMPLPNGDEADGIAPSDVQSLVERDFAYWLVKHQGPEPTVLFSTPIFSGAVAFYGGLRVAASADEGNQAGVLTAIRILSADTLEEVSILTNAQKITHVALPMWDPALDQLVRVGMAVPATEPVPENVFAVALRKWAMPLWMGPLDYLIPRKPGFEGFDLRVFAAQAEQEPDLAVSRLADFFLQRGQLSEARALQNTLEEFPRSPVALAALANLHLAFRDRAGVEKAMGSLLPLLSRRVARNLPVDRRIGLATLFQDTNRPTLAGEQLTACFSELDDKTLRALTPGSVVNLVMLSRSLTISFPDRNLEALALDLIPPEVRRTLVPGK